MALDRVRTTAGWVQGIPCGDPSFTVFKGIPYARPPIGERRWTAPEDPEPWEGIRRCDTFPPMAMQTRPLKGQFYQREWFPVELPMSEDCLYLSIWTPASVYEAPPDPDGQEVPVEPFPVMMWIHGGAFQNGYGHEQEFDGEAFCRRGVILVTVTYRLGALGFFAHPALSRRSPHAVSGNYGILDQIHALRWIRENIAAFGGDPDNVTIFGQSSGGASVRTLAVSPLARGLFHKAIIQSAGGISRGRDLSLGDAESRGVTLCQEIGRDISQLLSLTSDDFMALVLEATPWRDRVGMWRPNVDGYVLDESPGQAIAHGRHANVPYMTGSVAGDGGLGMGAPVGTKAAFEEMIRAQHGAYADRYLSLLEVQDDDSALVAQGRRSRVMPLAAPRTLAWAHVRQGRQPVYLYYFDRDVPGEDRPGAFHSSELWYVFGTLTRCWRPLTGVDYDISLAMTDYWTNFAKSGDPNGPSVPQWPAFSEERPVTMRINEKVVEAQDMSDVPLLREMEELMLEEIFETPAE